MDTPTNTQAQADGGEGPESPEEITAANPMERECSYCGATYIKKDPRQVLCLRCTVEDYL